MNKSKEENKKNEQNKKTTKISLTVAILIVIAIVAIVTVITIAVIKIDVKEEDNCCINQDIQKSNYVNTNTNINTDIIEDNAEVNYKDIPCLKPIIYIYPEEEMNVTIKARYASKFTCTYPKYNEETGWTVTAKPDGTLMDNKTGRSLYALYWEGINTNNAEEKEEGFIVKGTDVASFLEEKLAILGLNEREAEEFIVYWLPQMEDNEYNYIRFETMEEINENMPLEITPEPTTLIRVMMEWKATEYKKIKEQTLNTVTRTGYTVVEWGGTILK